MKIYLKDLSDFRKVHSNESIILVPGTFDLLHVGHVNYLNQIRNKYKGLLMVAVCSDVRTKRVKGPQRPIIKQSERVEMVDNLKSVDYAFVQPENYKDGIRPLMQVIQTLKPDIFVTSERGWDKSKAFFDKYGTEIHYFSRIDKTSTTRIIKRIQK